MSNFSDKERRHELALEAKFKKKMDEMYQFDEQPKPPSLADSVRELQTRHDAMEYLLGEVVATFSLEKNRSEISATGQTGEALLAIAARWKTRFLQIMRKEPE